MKQKLRIAFDVDDVLNEFTEKVLEEMEREFHHPFPYKDVIWGFENYRPEETAYAHELFRDENFIDSVPFIEGIENMLEELVKRGHDIIFPTSTYSAVMSARALRLYEHLPFIHPRNYVMTGRKDIISSNIQFDDCMAHIASSNSDIPVLVNKPWNKDNTGYVRCDSKVSDYMKIIEMAEQGYTKQDIYKELNVVCETKGPHIIVVVGGSGMGKSTILKAILDADDGYEKVVTNTTRDPRPGEKHGEDYFYRSKQEFSDMVKDGIMLEYTTYAGNMYGTSKDVIDRILAKGKNAITIMDVDGVKHIREAYPDKSYSVQIVRKKEDLIRSILERDMPTEDMVRRIAQLEEESQDAEKFCNYRILNENIHDAANEIINIFKG